MTPDKQAILNALTTRIGQFQSQNARMAAGQPMPPDQQAIADSLPDPDMSQDPVVGNMLAMRANAANKPVLAGLPDPEVPATKPSSRPWQPEISSAVPEGFDGQRGMDRIKAADIARGIAARQAELEAWDAREIGQSGIPDASPSIAWQENNENRDPRKVSMMRNNSRPALPADILAKRAEAVRAMRAEKEAYANEMLHTQGLARQNRRQGMANPYGNAQAEIFMRGLLNGGGDGADLANAALTGGQAGAVQHVRNRGELGVENVRAGAQRYDADQRLAGIKYNTDGTVRAAQVGADGQIEGARIGADGRIEEARIGADAEAAHDKANIAIKQMDIDEAKRLLAEGKSPEQIHMEFVAAETKALIERNATVTPQKSAEIAERARHVVAAAKNTTPPPIAATPPGHTTPNFRPEQIARLQEVFDRNDPFRFKKNALAGFLQYLPGLTDADWEEQFMRELEYDLPGLEITPEQARAFYKNRLAMENSAMPLQWD